MCYGYLLIEVGGAVGSEVRVLLYSLGSVQVVGLVV